MLDDNVQEFVIDNIPEIAMDFEGFDFDKLALSPLPDCDHSAHVVEESSADSELDGGDEDANPNILHHKIPENATNVNEVDATIAKQMMALSVEDREKVYMDVHGVKEGPQEVKEDIQAGLDAMQLEIEKLKDKDAYELARSMNQQYVENRSFRLAFLRSVYYDPRKAAISMVRHFQLKQDLFGKEKLALDIVQDDLDRETIDALHSGRGQLLDSTDRAGRYITLIFYGDVFSAKTSLQKAFYNAMLAYRNPDRQLQGTVVIVFVLPNSPQQLVDIAKHWDISKMNAGIPLRAEAAHFCQYGSIPQEVLTVSKAALNPSLKVRTRTHCGTHMEILASLAQYGIAPGTIPISEGFEVTNVKAFQEHLKKTRSTERLQQPRRQSIIVPSASDVLFGRGVPCQMHPGNVELRTLVSERFKSYEKAAKGIKLRIAQEIVERIQQNCGLFLRPNDDDSWICVEDDVARRKVSNLFRTLRLRIGKK